MPHSANWGSLLGVSILAGIGFTMSMFIGTLAFEGSNAIHATGMRLGVICGSLVSAVVGGIILLIWLPRGEKRPAPSDGVESTSSEEAP